MTRPYHPNYLQLPATTMASISHRHPLRSLRSCDIFLLRCKHLSQAPPPIPKQTRRCDRIVNLPLTSSTLSTPRILSQVTPVRYRSSSAITPSHKEQQYLRIRCGSKPSRTKAKVCSSEGCRLVLNSLINASTLRAYSDWGHESSNKLFAPSHPLLSYPIKQSLT